MPIGNRAIHIPTGAGKTAAVVLAWLWRLRTGDAPRRLVYLLPMRTLVDQTYAAAKDWAHEDAKVYKMLGGEVEEEWEKHPEEPAIVIGTMDLLLSRMLNRGFAMSRYRWPIPFALLNNDCLIVADEIQLMGNGLSTTAQMTAWRQRYPTFGTVNSWWLSATLDPQWLKTPDYQEELELIQLTEADKQNGLEKRYHAEKKLTVDAGADLADLAFTQHVAATLTLVMVNTVERAQKLYESLLKKTNGSEIEMVLAHSRFREAEKNGLLGKLEATLPAAGRIVVATQVLEAGVDLSAKLLITQIAPWASLVQRFGRCNREGTTNESRIIVLKLNDQDCAPYELRDIEDSLKKLIELGDNAALSELERVGLPSIPPPTHVIRRKDFSELFDTTPDLAGADLDISRFIRDQDDTDVQVFWRDLPKSESSDQPDPTNQPRPARGEICSVLIGRFKEFLRDRTKSNTRVAWRWNPLEKLWDSIRENEVAPGQVYLIAATAGGYSETYGWDKALKKPVAEVPSGTDSPESYDRENSSDWLTIAEHTDHVVAHAKNLAEQVGLSEEDKAILMLAARWHDRGKSHPVFQKALGRGEKSDWGKSPGGMKRYERVHFRHELASALAILHPSCPVPADQRDLVAYLAASHHGKVRGSLRSLPGEKTGPVRLARGVREDDVLPEVDLGGGVVAPEVSLSLEVMELGESDVTGPSWTARVQDLLQKLGPFRLAYLEALLCIADRRASQEESVTCR